MKYFGKLSAVIGLTAVLLAFPTKATAQDYASSFFKIGVKGGINFTSMSRFELGYISESVRNYTGFSAGLAFSFDLPVQGMTIQPELNYISKGAMYNGPENFRFRTDFIELPVNLQVGLDLILLRPYLMVSPYIGYAVHKLPEEMPWSGINRFQYGIGIGGGVDFWRFQLQVKYNWNIGQLISGIPENGVQIGSGENVEEPSGPVRMGNFRGLEVNLVFFF